MFAGLNGVMTGLKPGLFSISLNTRKPSVRKNPFGLLMNVIALFFKDP
jgi:hypothetical protein